MNKKTKVRLVDNVASKCLDTKNYIKDNLKEKT